MCSLPGRRMARYGLKAGVAFLVTATLAVTVYYYHRRIGGPAPIYLHTQDFITAKLIHKKQQEATTNTIKDKPELKSESAQKKQERSYKSEMAIANDESKAEVAVGQVPTCDSVTRRISASPVFSEKIKKIRILWNEETRNLSSDLKQKWLSIQHRGVSDYEQTLDDLLKILPGEDVFTDWRKKGCVRCAVIGNSKNLLGSGYGPLIDTNDVVFRMNKCPMKGYEKDVGTKTTVHVVYPESASEYQQGSILMLVPFKVADLKWLKSALTTHDFQGGRFWRTPPKSINASQILIAHPELIIEAKSVYNGRVQSYPSTGGMMLLASLHLCDKVNVFGFGLGPHGEYGHYYNKSAGKSVTSHDGNAEAQMRESLEQEKIIKVFKGRY